MKVLFFILFAGYAVRCDENNYYVIEMRDDTPRQQKPFKVYWNVPTMQCQSKRIPFENLFQKFGIIQNENDKFMGEKVTILYDPGLFPALLKNETSGRFKFRNGGVPQEGDLYKHLQAFTEVLDQSIPDKAFDGVGIIDFESWRPVYRQNFGVLRPYKDVSLEIERKLHWWWQKKWLEDEAKKRFEEAARTFMQKTIAVAKQLRPNAQWGFYGFPYCFNMASNNMVEACASNVPQENDNLSWLWSESTTLYPSVYSSVDLSTSELTALIRGRVMEAARFGRRIIPYFWYRYRDAGFLSQVDLAAALDTLYKSNASGFIIWGSSSDVNTVQKCTKLLDYIEHIMGPAIAKYTQARTLQDIDDIRNYTSADGPETVAKDTTTASSGVTTSNPNDNNTNRVKNLDPEYHWIPPDNYTQAIKDHVAEEISKKLTNYTQNSEETVLDNNVLIDLILNSVINRNASDLNENSTVDKHSSSTEIEEISTTTEVTHRVVLETTTRTNETATSIDIDKVHLELGIISSTESAKSSETTTIVDSHSTTSQTYDKTTVKYETSTAPHKFTSDITVTSMDKNQKKIDFQGNIEEFFDITTETPLSTDITESNIDIVENTAIFSNFRTESSFLNKEEDFTTEVTETIGFETTAKDYYRVLTTKIGEIDTYTTETLISSQSTTLKSNDKAETDSSTTEFGISVTTEQNTIIYPDLKENNVTIHPDFNGITETDIISTKAPELHENTEIEVTKDTINFEEEETSLMSTSTSTEQVVVYVS